MKYAGMPMGMWLLFCGSFRKQLIKALQYDERTAKRVAAQAKPKYKEIIARLPEFEKTDRFKMNIINCAMRIQKERGMRNMRDLYEMRLSDAQWWACDVPGNIGWIVWIVCAVLCLADGIGLFSSLAVIPALLMLVGVIELISERIAGLGRVLPKARVLRGFGALALGGGLGIPIAVYGWMSQTNGNYPKWMLAGAVLCAVFAGLCWRGYTRKEE